MDDSSSSSNDIPTTYPSLRAVANTKIYFFLLTGKSEETSMAKGRRRGRYAGRGPEALCRAG